MIAMCVLYATAIVTLVVTWITAERSRRGSEPLSYQAVGLRMLAVLAVVGAVGVIGVVAASSGSWWLSAGLLACVAGGWLLRNWRRAIRRGNDGTPPEGGSQ